MYTLNKSEREINMYKTTTSDVELFVAKYVAASDFPDFISKQIPGHMTCTFGVK
jgi:hypothetical protein